MSRLSIIKAAALVLLAVASAAASPAVVETEPLAPEDQRAKFRLAPGFEIQLVAAEPDIQKPMNMAFDTRGRLWVTHSVEYPFAAALGTPPRDGLTVLEDFDADGRARKVTRFADGLNIPIGVLPLPCVHPSGRGQEVIVWSIPNIWKLTDTDGDGRADAREVLYGPFACDDTHGNQNSFRLAADGWVYANHGFRNHSRVKLRGEGADVLELKSGNGYRFRPDGSAIEQVSWGQINPFGMDFDALGNRYNADCHSRPLTMLMRGGRYPNPFGLRNADYDDGVGAAPETTADSHGSTGICAVAVCDTTRMPPAYQGSIFVGNVVTNVVHRDVVQWRGSSPWVEKPEEFLACDDWWFRPVDLAMGPDGCLYIADFYNCIIGHYEVDLKHPRRDRTRGRIWRVAWKEAGQTGAAPDVTGLSHEKLVALLDGPTESLRRLAFDQLVARGRTDPGVAVAIRGASLGEHGRARSLRALGLLGLLDDATIRAAANDSSRLVRVHLVTAVAELPGDAGQHAGLFRRRLTDPDPFVRRAAAEAVVARPTVDAVPDLLAAIRSAAADDPQLRHALRMAVAASLRSADPARLAVMPVATADQTTLLDIVAGLPGEVFAGYGLALSRQGEPSAAALARVCRSVARYADDTQVEDATAYARASCGDDIDRTATVIQAMLDGRRESGRPIATESGLAGWSRWFLEAVGGLATRPSDAAVKAAVAAATGISVEHSLGLLLTVVRDPARPVDLRRDAAAAAVAVDRPASVEALMSRLATRDEASAARVEFVKQLAAIDMPQARQAVGLAISTAAAAEQRALAFAALADRGAAEAVLALVEQGKVSARLLQDQQIARRLRELGVAEAEQRIGRLTRGLPSPDERARGVIERVSQKLTEGKGTAAAGLAVFTKNCAACHRFGGSGGLVGPQLDGVAQRGVERLLEDILDPNRNVDAAFRTTVAMLSDGRVVSGLRLQDDGDDAVFVESTGREIRVRRADIEETNVTPLSPMPATMTDQVGEEGLPDLIAYLRGGTTARK